MDTQEREHKIDTAGTSGPASEWNEGDKQFEFFKMGEVCYFYKTVELPHFEPPATAIVVFKGSPMPNTW